MKIIKAAAIIAGVMLISACASQIPPQIRQALENAPGIAQVHEDSDAYIAQNVHWGGVLLQTENKDKTSRLTIVAYPLDSRGKPISTSHSSGRFIAIADQFLEPEVYSADRKVTITGSLLRTEAVNVGEFAYDYPVIDIDQVYLWPRVRDQQFSDRSPFWYDPWTRPYQNSYSRRHYFYDPYSYFYFPYNLHR